MAKMKVRYKGAADRRILPAKALKARGVTGVDEDLEFSPRNAWSMEIEVDDKLHEILKADAAFTVRAVTDSGSEGEQTATATKADDTADTVVDEESGQVDKRTTNAPLSSGSDAPAGGGTTAVNSSTSGAGTGSSTAGR
jgi:hypothetical protein